MYSPKAITPDDRNDVGTLPSNCTSTDASVASAYRSINCQKPDSGLHASLASNFVSHPKVLS